MRFPASLLVALAVAVSLLASGCSSWRGKKRPKHETVVARLLIEARGGDVGGSVRLPRSESVIPINPKALIGEFDILSADVMDAELGKALVFQLTQDAARDFHRITLTNQGLRIVTLLNGVPVGARRIDTPAGSGFWFTYVELDESADLVKLAKDITLTSEEARERLSKAKK